MSDKQQDSAQPPTDAAALRQRAEAQFRPMASPALSAQTPEEIQRMFHELRVHQIELEMQNEELRTAQAVIEGVRARYFDLYDLAPVGYCTLSEQGLIHEANLTAATLLGVTRGAVVTQPISRFIIKEDEDIYYLHRKKLFETGEPQECELRLAKPDGTLFWAHLAATAAQAENGAPICRVVLSDITERKQAEIALKESEQFLQILLESLPLPVFYKDVEGRYKGFNKAFETFFGRPKSELIGCSVFDINPPELARVYHSKDLELYENISKQIYESQVKNAYGELRDVIFHKATLTNTSGAITGLVGAIMDITERKQAEEQLRKSEEQFRNLYDEAPVGYFEYDLQGNITRVNRTELKMLGYSAEEMIGQPCWKFIVDEVAREQIMAKLDGVRPPAVGLERSYRRKDGTTFPVLFEDRLLSDEDGHIKGIRTAIQDITERKQAEEALWESEETYRALIDGLPDIVMRFDRDGRHLFVSDNVREVVDIEAAQFIGKTHAELGFPEVQCQFWEESIRQVFDSGTPFETEFTVKDKTAITFNWRLIPERYAQGAVSSVLSISRDITAQRKTEQEYTTLFREMLNGFALHEIVCNAEGEPVNYRFLAVNPAFERMTGLKAESIVGRTVLEVLPGAERHWIKTYGKVALSGEPVFFENYSAVLGKHFEVTAFRPLAGQFACIFEDITERKRAEEEGEKLQTQLTQAQKMESVGRLAGGVAHDFNNMLGVILGHTEMALDDVDPATPLHASLQAINYAAERSANLTRQLLTFARKQTIAPKVLDLNGTIESMLTLLRRLIGEDIDLLWKPGHGLGPVKIDPTQVDQILANLCVNARDAIADVGKVTIETGNASFDEDYCARHAGFVPGDYALLAVSDDGSGMDAETLSHLFEPFFTTKELGKGTGLGLATVYGAVKQNNGFINVYSEPGQGTTFKIYLPTFASKSAWVTEKEQELPTEHGHETILLVEDEPAILQMTTMMLTRLGYTVVPASTPGEAIRLALEYRGKIDLLMTDVVMPEMNGRKLAGNLLSHYPDLKRLFMSGYTANVIAHHGVLDEGVNFIQKPFSMKDLGGKLREALEG